MSIEKIPKAAWAAATVLAIVIVAGLVLVVSGSSSSGDDLQFTGPAYPGVDLANSREAEGSIDSSNVAELKVAWNLPLTAQSSYGAYSSSPVIADGVVYSQDLESNVQAINLETGEVLWTKKYEEPDQGPNGLVVSDGRVFGATPVAAFGLDAETGEQLWSTELVRSGAEGIDMPPGYFEGLVYVSTVPTEVNSAYNAGGTGVLWALDAKTGRRVWHFDTVPSDLWGDKSVNSGGGLWYAPSFDGKGSMYFGTGNPAPFPGVPGKPWGSSRPGPNLYTNSMVKLDAKTGKLRWYYQQTPHDLYDWDFQDPPILVEAGGRELAIGAGKSGIVTAVDTATGKPVWTRPVGAHNGHDDDGLLAMRGELSKLKTPMTVSPGTLGGVIAPMASDGSMVYVPVVNHAISVTSPTEISESASLSGELVAIDAQTGAVRWKHEFSSAPFGAPLVINDVVFATDFEGGIYALDAKSGGELWADVLPSGINAGLAASGDTLLAPAGAASAEGQLPQIVAYRLGG